MLLIAGIWGQSGASAQEAQETQETRYQGVFVVPFAAMKAETKGSTAVYHAEVAQDGSVNGNKEWQQSGAPSMISVMVAKVTKRRAYTDVELRETGTLGRVVRLRFAFPGDTNEVFERLVVAASKELGSAEAAADPAVASTQDPDGGRYEGMFVVPIAAMRAEKAGGRTIYHAEVADDGRVNGNREWRRSGPPSMIAVMVAKVSRKKTFTDVELRELEAQGRIVKLRFSFAGDTNEAFERLVIAAAESESYVTAALAAQPPAELASSVTPAGATAPVDKSNPTLPPEAVAAREAAIPAPAETPAEAVAPAPAVVAAVSAPEPVTAPAAAAEPAPVVVPEPAAAPAAVLAAAPVIVPEPIVAPVAAVAAAPVVVPEPVVAPVAAVAAAPVVVSEPAAAPVSAAATAPAVVPEPIAPAATVTAAPAAAPKPAAAPAATVTSAPVASPKRVADPAPAVLFPSATPNAAIAPVPPVTALSRERQEGVFVVPLSALSADPRSARPVYYAEVSEDGAVNGSRDWRLKGFPSMLPVQVAKVTRKKTYTDVELREPAEAGTVVKLRFTFAGETNDVFERLVVESATKTAYLESTYAALAGDLMAGSLAKLPASTQIELVKFVDTAEISTRIREEHYQGRLYVAFDLGRHATEFDGVRMNQTARAARALNDRMLEVVKAFGSVAGVSERHGLKLELLVPHRDAAGASAVVRTDKLALYAPAQAIRQFAAGQIANQQFLDACAVILNGHWIHVPLSVLRN
jgi:hypothetical protein